MKKSKSQSPGHNPAAALVMLGIILLGLMIVFSGSLLLASKGQGFFSSVSIGLSPDTLKEIHEISVNVVIALVIFHLLGNLVDFISNRKVGTLQSMFTGYKNIEGESIQLTTFQKILATIGILSAIAIFPYSEMNQKIDGKSENKEQQLKENEDVDSD